jgi:hypothetical protein
MPSSPVLELADYRRRVAEIYTRARDRKINPEDRWDRYKSDKDELFRHHPQSPLAPE